jgi:hypothetical protein
MKVALIRCQSAGVVAISKNFNPVEQQVTHVIPKANGYVIRHATEPAQVKWTAVTRKECGGLFVDASGLVQNLRILPFEEKPGDLFVDV